MLPFSRGKSYRELETSANMVKLRQLLGGAREVSFECMYTKHKTQKRKIWHDGFVTLHDSRRLVLYEECSPEGTILDEAKMSVFEWERKDEEYISVPKFLIEIINETPIQIQESENDGLTLSSDGLGTIFNKESVPESAQLEPPVVRIPPRRPGQPISRPAHHSKFKSPLGPTSSLASSAQPSSYRPSRLTKFVGSKPPPPADPFDFGRNPTSEWDYAPNAVSRTPHEVAAMWFANADE